MCEKIKCRVCANSVDNKIYPIKERQLNKGEIFHYLLCKKCGTLQLIENISDIGVYYPKSYPAFRTRESKRISFLGKMKRKLLMLLLLNVKIPQKNRDIIINSKNEHLNTLIGTHLSMKSRMLDVGCGAGNWIRNLREDGFSDLTGVDLFTNEPKDIEGWQFIKGEIYSKKLGTYDCITFHHSFEHMTEPIHVLARVSELLKPNGLCIIRIPIMESLAWDMYGTNWFQIDAPRHFYLYTVRALKYLCKRAGLEITKVVYDSSPTQFYVSDRYQKTDYDLKTIEKRLDKKREQHVKMAQEANCSRKGDQAIFYIRKRRNKKT